MAAIRASSSPPAPRIGKLHSPSSLRRHHHYHFVIIIIISSSLLLRHNHIAIPSSSAFAPMSSKTLESFPKLLSHVSLFLQHLKSFCTLQPGVRACVRIYTVENWDQFLEVNEIIFIVMKRDVREWASCRWCRMLHFWKLKPAFSSGWWLSTNWKWKMFLLWKNFKKFASCGWCQMLKLNAGVSQESARGKEKNKNKKIRKNKTKKTQKLKKTKFTGVCMWCTSACATGQEKNKVWRMVC